MPSLGYNSTFYPFRSPCQLAPHHRHHYRVLLFATGQEALGCGVKTSLTTELLRITEAVLALGPSAGCLVSIFFTGRDPVGTKDTSGSIWQRERQREGWKPPRGWTTARSQSPQSGKYWEEVKQSTSRNGDGQTPVSLSLAPDVEIIKQECDLLWSLAGGGNQFTTY